jgi:AmmeMemoRadiSam system protein A
VLTLLNITSAQPAIQVEHVKYMNSGDSPYGDKVNVVGYHAFIFTRSVGSSSSIEFNLSPEDKKMLLKIARESIEAKLKNRSEPKIRDNELPENLKTNYGAFVTLNKKGRLRGCIGRFMPNQPLYKVVQEMAVSAAFHDTRFAPVAKEEIKNIDIEISVLTPLKQIYSIDDFQLGKHGIYIIKGNRSGTYLPQVAESTGWNKEEFMGHCSREKAGIGWNGWKNADLYTYEAMIFHEKELLSHKK